MKTIPLLSLDHTRQARKPIPSKLYTLKMKHLLKSKRLSEAKNLYIQTVLMGDEPGVILGSILIDMLMKSRFMEDAFQVFDKMPEKNVVTWTSMVLGCVLNNCEEDGVCLFIDMLESGVAPNDYAYNAALQVCTSLCSLSLGERIHSLILRSGFGGDRRVANSLIEFYSRCGLMDKAARVFNGILELDLVSYTSMISGLCRNNCFGSAVKLFCQMVRLGIEPNEHTITSILTACGLQLGEEIHGYMIKNKIAQSVFSSSSLIELYSRNYKVKQAELVFRKMGCRNVITWSSMISCFMRHDRAQDALRLFFQMIYEGIEPNDFTFATVIMASGLCANLEPINFGHQLHAWVIKLNMVSDNRILNALLTMYADIGEVEELDKVLDKNENSDIVSWCAVISGYFQNGFYERSAGLLCEMHSKGLKPNEYGFSSALSSCANLPLINQGRQLHCLALKSGCDLDVCVGNALINLYAKCGFLDDARLEFDVMPVHDIMSWNSLIHGYANHGFGCKSLELFGEIPESESCLPNHSTFLGLLVGCNHMGYVSEANKFFKVMDECYGLVPAASHYACMVDIMGRSGNLEEALCIIKEMPYEPDVFIWKSLLGSCRLHRNLDLGKFAAEKVIELSPKDSAGYVQLSNLHSMHGEWENAERVRSLMEKKGVKKDAGWSWIEIRNEVNSFHANNESHPKVEMIYQVLNELFGIMKDEAIY
ncbi:hypothetical protein IEQ34_001474 [Dendrobium chrysotoxum]|uniref:Chlororespiratory reduction 21 n=1 Tax=Dendrobium chrysotoxum TaxID=161865 RepID=A0AAV7HLR8_DENCH|nr:hypothetical protein IEQ34_001474 [Dendrobium chrysotoxum]